MNTRHGVVSHMPLTLRPPTDLGSCVPDQVSSTEAIAARGLSSVNDVARRLNSLRLIAGSVDQITNVSSVTPLSLPSTLTIAMLPATVPEQRHCVRPLGTLSFSPGAQR